MSMTPLTTNEGLNKGSIITQIEVSPISQGAGTPQHRFIDTEFVSKFEITHVNPKTYTCKYIEGYLKGSGFKWPRPQELNGKAKYFI